MIASSGEEIDFGSTRFLQAVQQPVYLVNNGSNELNIDSIYVEANVGFSASIGGLLLQVGSSLTGGKTIRSIPTVCLLYTSPSPRDLSTSRMPSSA